MEKNDIFKNLEDDVNQSPLSDEVKSKMYQNIRKLKQEKINLMITGATGSGKSSTINALFDLEVAKVGTGVDPETMDIQKFDLDNLVLWDSPGLGDGKEKDIEHSKGIIKKLNEREKPIVFILWGKFAISKKMLITNPIHLVLESPHPSPLSASRGFFGNNHFLKVNDFLKSKGIKEIDWTL